MSIFCLWQYLNAPTCSFLRQVLRSIPASFVLPGIKEDNRKNNASMVSYFNPFVLARYYFAVSRLSRQEIWYLNYSSAIFEANIRRKILSSKLFFFFFFSETLRGCCLRPGGRRAERARRDRLWAPHHQEDEIKLKRKKKCIGQNTDSQRWGKKILAKSDTVAFFCLSHRLCKLAVCVCWF